MDTRGGGSYHGRGLRRLRTSEQFIFRATTLADWCRRGKSQKLAAFPFSSAPFTVRRISIPLKPVVHTILMDCGPAGSQYALRYPPERAPGAVRTINPFGLPSAGAAFREKLNSTGRNQIFRVFAKFQIWTPRR